jgi:hypothetical protein
MLRETLQARRELKNGKGVDLVRASRAKLDRSGSGHQLDRRLICILELQTWSMVGIYLKHVKSLWSHYVVVSHTGIDEVQRILFAKPIDQVMRNLGLSHFDTSKDLMLETFDYLPACLIVAMRASQSDYQGTAV